MKTARPLSEHLPSGIRPYFDDGTIAIYHGDCRELLPLFPVEVDAVLTDPPYGETSLKWDRWPSGWPTDVRRLTRSMWCFGSFRMFMETRGDFDGWKISQEVVWEKHNGTNAADDRFRRVHELAVHFYRDDVAWKDIYKAPVYTNDAIKRSVRRKQRVPQWGAIGGATYKSEEGGPRLMSSVIYSRSCHGYAVHPTQKPEGIVLPLVEYSVPVGGVLIDCFMGSGTALRVAKDSGRRAIGIETNEADCEKAAMRLSQGALPLNVLGMEWTEAA